MRRRLRGRATGRFSGPVAGFLTSVAVCSCAPPPPTLASNPTHPAPQRKRFAEPPRGLEGHVLYSILLDVLELPRWLGAPNRAEGIRALEAMAAARGAAVTRQPFEALDPQTHEAYSLENLYASVRPAAPHQFVIATHYDIRPWAEEDADPRRRGSPIPGANDGTSGVAVALGLLASLRRDLDADVGFTVIFFDGEELGRPGHGGYCAGSRHLAEHPEALPTSVRRAAFGIVLDMVGDADLELNMEPRSLRHNGPLVDEVWSAAARLGADAFVPRKGATGIIDDHVGLTEAGIPSVLLIDYAYSAWHTHQDTAERVSAESLETVAHVVYETVRHRYVK